MRKIALVALGVILAGIGIGIGHADTPWSTFIFNAPDRVTVNGGERIGVAVAAGNTEYVTPDEILVYYQGQPLSFSDTVGINGVATFGAGIKVPTRTITAAGAVTAAAATDYFICVNKTVGAATVVNIPDPTTVAKVSFLIKDCKGDAATHNITVTPAAGTVDGSATLVMSTNYQSVAVTSDGLAWYVN